MSAPEEVKTMNSLQTKDYDKFCTLTDDETARAMYKKSLEQVYRLRSQVSATLEETRDQTKTITTLTAEVEALKAEVAALKAKPDVIAHVPDDEVEALRAQVAKLEKKTATAEKEKERSHTKRVASSRVKIDGEPTAADYRLPKDEIRTDCCQARVCTDRDMDTRFSPYVYPEHQCQNAADAEDGLCKMHAKHREGTANGTEFKPGKYHLWCGFITEEPPKWVHMLDSAWAAYRTPTFDASRKLPDTVTAPKKEKKIKTPPPEKGPRPTLYSKTLALAVKEGKITHEAAMELHEKDAAAAAVRADARKTIREITGSAAGPVFAGAGALALDPPKKKEYVCDMTAKPIKVVHEGREYSGGMMVRCLAEGKRNKCYHLNEETEKVEHYVGLWDEDKEELIPAMPEDEGEDGSVEGSVDE
jgi:polyhydroxyalkanoate synthesis regulator phasin